MGRPNPRSKVLHCLSINRKEVQLPLGSVCPRSAQCALRLVCLTLPPAACTHVRGQSGWGNSLSATGRSVQSVTACREERQGDINLTLPLSDQLVNITTQCVQKTCRQCHASVHLAVSPPAPYAEWTPYHPHSPEICNRSQTKNYSGNGSLYPHQRSIPISKVF